MKDDFTKLIERVKPETITAQEVRKRVEELRIVAARPDYQNTGAVIIYTDTKGKYYRVNRGRMG